MELAITESSHSWDHRPLGELADYIEERYHTALRREVPRLIQAARHVERVHADAEGAPTGLTAELEQLWAELRSHIAKEEAVLFPTIRRGGRGSRIYGPVRVMEEEHRDHRERLVRVRELTGNMVAPAGACATWSSLYDGLSRLAAELEEHIHLENNILFLRAVREA